MLRTTLLVARKEFTTQFLSPVAATTCDATVQSNAAALMAFFRVQSILCGDFVEQQSYDHQSPAVIVLSELASPPFSIKENGRRRRRKNGRRLGGPGRGVFPPKTGRGTLIKRGGRRKLSSAHAINHRLRFALVTPTLIALIVGCWARREIMRPPPDKDDGCSGF